MAKRAPQTSYTVVNGLVSEFGRVEAMIKQRLAECPQKDESNRAILEWRLRQVQAAFKTFLETE